MGLTGMRIMEKIHNEKHNDQIEKNEMSGAVACMGERRGVYRVLVGKPEGKRPLGRPRRRWEDNTKKDLQEMGWGHRLD